MHYFELNSVFAPRLSGLQTFGRQDVWATEVWATFLDDYLGDTGWTFRRQQLDVWATMNICSGKVFSSSLSPKWSSQKIFVAQASVAQTSCRPNVCTPCSPYTPVAWLPTRATFTWKIINIDTYCVSGANHRQGVGYSFWQYKVCADIRGSSLKRGVKRQLGRSFNARFTYLNFFRIEPSRVTSHAYI